MHTVICDWGDSGVFWAVFEDLRRDEAKFFNHFYNAFEELYETIEYFL